MTPCISGPPCHPLMSVPYPHKGPCAVRFKIHYDRDAYVSTVKRFKIA